MARHIFKKDDQIPTVLPKNGYLTRRPTFDFHRQQNLRLALIRARISSLSFIACLVSSVTDEISYSS
jgi:hypothetical protein